MFGFGEQFATDESIIKSAFYEVIDKTDIDNNIKDKLFILYSKANRDGSPRKEIEAIRSCLEERDFHWHEFNKWDSRFSEIGYPYMWLRYQDYRKQQEVMQKSDKDSLAFFNISEMRLILKDNNCYQKPAPKTRNDVENAMINSLDSFILKRLIDTKKKSNIDAIGRKIINEKYEILSHYIAFTVYKKRDISKNKYKEGRHYSFVFANTSCCDVEKVFADEFNTNKRHDLPPYFPGDRTSMLCFKDGRSANDKGCFGGQYFSLQEK